MFLIETASASATNIMHHSTMEPGSNTLMELNAIGVGEIETTKLLQTPNGWFFVSLRSLNVSEGYLCRIVARKLVDFDALTELNFGRSDPVLTLLGEDDQVIAISFQPNANNL
jgi:DNA-binding MurR/RpiR family transcriptional regulator